MGVRYRAPCTLAQMSLEKQHLGDIPKRSERYSACHTGPANSLQVLTQQLQVAIAPAEVQRTGGTLHLPVCWIHMGSVMAGMGLESSHEQLYDLCRAHSVFPTMSYIQHQSLKCTFPDTSQMISNYTSMAPSLCLVLLPLQSLKATVTAATKSQACHSHRVFTLRAAINFPTQNQRAVVSPLHVHHRHTNPSRRLLRLSILHLICPPQPH